MLTQAYKIESGQIKKTLKRERWREGGIVIKVNLIPTFRKEVVGPAVGARLKVTMVFFCSEHKEFFIKILIQKWADRKPVEEGEREKIFLLLA